jgi:hypothetical protein
MTIWGLGNHKGYQGQNADNTREVGNTATDMKISSWPRKAWELCFSLKAIKEY